MSTDVSTTRSGAEENETLAGLRATVLNGILWATVPLGGLATAAGIIDELRPDPTINVGLIVVYAFSYGILVAAAVDRRLGYRIRGVVFLLVLYSVALSELFSFGLSSVAPLFLFAFVVFAGTLFGLGLGVAAFVLSVLSIAGTACLVLSGRLYYGPLHQQLAVDGMSWITMSMPLVFISAGALVSLSLLLNSLERNMRSAQGLVADLRTEMAERGRIEEELEKLAAAVQHSKELVNLATLDGRMIFLNVAGCAMLGIAPEAVEQIQILEVIPDHLQEMVQRELLPALMKGGSWEGELQYRNLQTGGLTDVYAMTFVVTDRRTGAPQFLANVSLDVTERKRAEGEREKLQAQLTQAQKMESIGRLAGGVAHDFNNMLGVILGHAELALDQVDPAQPLYADLEDIRKAAQRSADLTRQLLAFARKQTIAPKVLDLNRTVQGMLKMLQRLIGEDIDLAWMPGAGLWPVRVDPAQIDQILANLCVNARDAIAGVGKVTIETGNVTFDEAHCADHPGFVPGAYVLLAVSDDGYGMDKDMIEHLFEPFFTTKGAGQGTGLGLATVYGIVKQNDGFVNVYSEPGTGTTFKVYLPQSTGQVVESKTVSAGEVPLGSGETVLLVEDEVAILDLGKTMLKKLGYTVLTAKSPSEAVRLAETYAGEIQLVITDVVMPEMDGRTMAARLSAIEPGLRCLFMSGYTANVIAHRGILEEGVQFIQKPFSINALAAKVREAIEQR